MVDATRKAIDAIRRRIDHPIIDGDGHIVEFVPAVRDALVRIGGESMAAELDVFFSASRVARGLDAETRRGLGLHRLSWWAFPADTRDRATAMLPALLAERLPDLGIDFAVVYPTFGLMIPHIDDPDLRRAACRAFNETYAAAFGDHADRLTPAAVIPMHTPAEAIEALDHAVGTLGLRAAVVAGLVPRPLPGRNESRAARWIDSLGPDEPTAYDAVWRRCAELGVTPTFHSSAMGWGSRASLTSYVHNHIGNFAAGGEATCRSLFLGGVFARFPELRFAFLEGGVGWAANLFSDLVGHFEKRGGAAISALDPARLDRARLGDLFRRYAPKPYLAALDRLDSGLEILSDPDEDRAGLDEFRHTGARSAEDIRRTFTEQLFFGCEADDPMTAVAFDGRTCPLGARLRALFSSDIGHWDVPDMGGVLLEAWEGVEEGRLDEADFRDFTFRNAVDLFTATNPRFFEGTAVADAVTRERGDAPAAD
jgi:predicted TIM-barrel fold metal-dependent hydrolase